ncbi:hypothetical protein [Bifidobacterium sp. SO1]|uniref:hypothetical protein n=1 Tax=Bifidobacterium sp. SO1 TaxID=2809029 RepID=UPI001BDD55C9|nr:hypothetical protein [Bifidobacterium sp. SO1]MBT1161779.1 hypothetical protein [Bifidobacterium sp. SO1]
MTLTPYEDYDDALHVHVLWDSAKHMPDMPRGEYERRCARLAALMPAGIRPMVEHRLIADADHAGDMASPYDAGQLHMWELYRIEARGSNAMIAGMDAWVGDDGIPAIIAAPDEDLAMPAGEAAKTGWPALRVWVRGDEDPLPYRMLLIRP